MIFKLIALGVSFGFAISISDAAFAANAPKSGVYDELLLARNPTTSEITGYFSSETGGGNFTCIFYFKGKLKAGAADIESYFPATPLEKINGLLTVDSDDSVTIKLKDDHGGCWNVQHFADPDQPASFRVSAAHSNWNAIRVVRVAKASLYSSPKDKSPMKAYLVKGNGVGVVDSQPDWVKIDYSGEKKTTSGWIKRADLY